VQRGDGAYGALIIEDTKDPHRHLYDFDLPEHTLILNDWLHQPSQSSFILHHFGNGDNKPVSMLINGKGRFGHGAFMSSTNSTPLLPLENFTVQKVENISISAYNLNLKFVG
jgi:L-ascorbate oxidase